MFHLCLSAAFALALLRCSFAADGPVCSSGDGDCDTTAVLQVRSRQSVQAPASRAEDVAGEDSEASCPIEFTRNEKPGGGSFVVYNFTLVFDAYHSYWRRFGVDLPSQEARKRCPKSGCPILVDFPGSGDSVYTQRAWTRWFEFQEVTPQPYILITMEGSPDGVVRSGTEKHEVLPCNNDTAPEICRSSDYLSQGATSWNVLGWGTPSPNMETGENTRTPKDSTSLQDRRLHKDGRHMFSEGEYPSDSEPYEATWSWKEAEAGKTADICKQQPKAGCFQPSLYPWNAYQCFGTDLAKNPKACRNIDAEYKSYLKQISYTNCSSASAANDWDYVRRVLRYVAGGAACAGLRGDRDHIYFSGQSMGGMASIQFAVPQRGNKYHLGGYKPKAIIACSSGGSRQNKANLEGKVPALLIQGYMDDIAPGSVWAGYNRNDPYYVKTSYLLRSRQFEELRENNSLVKHGLNLQGKKRDVPSRSQTGLRTNILLNADTQFGGELLEPYARTGLANGRLGCPSTFDKRITAIGGDSYLWETFGTTMARVAGKNFDMRRLKYRTPEDFEERASDIELTCANVTEAAGTRAEIRTCTYRGSHTYPWLDGTEAEVLAFHQFIWDSWFKGGTRV